MNRLIVPQNMMWWNPILDDDFKFMLDVHNDPEVLHNLTHPEPVSLKDHMAWVKRIMKDPCEMRAIFMVDEQRVGVMKFYRIDQTNHCCTLGADIHRDFRGKGYAKYMWTSMLAWAFNTPNVRLHRVGITTAEYNTVARHIYARLGFKEEGRLTQSLYRDGRYHDEVCMRMFKEEWAAMPVIA